MVENFIKKHERKVQRALEILPGFFSWSVILFPFWGAFLVPTAVAYFIIAFDVYWLYQSFITGILALLAHFKIKAASRFDWLGDVKSFPDWKRVHHIIIIPTYKEPIYILKRTLDGLLKQTFPKKQVTVVLAFEKREGKPAREKARELKKEYQEKFGNLLTTFHPDLPGEVKGKSSNTCWAAKIAKNKLVDQGKLDINYITITSEDADVVLHPRYFAALAFKFLDSPRRYNLIFQPAVQFYNNIWQLPAITRAFNTTSTIYNTGVLLRHDRLINFSTYSSSLKMVDKVGYWDTNVIPEDYRLFFKSFFKLKGRVDVEPIFLPAFADAALSTSFWKTLVNQYEQIKRWAWGVSDDAYLIKNWLTVKGVPFWEKTIRVTRVLETHFLWPVNWFILTLGAILPPLINKDFGRTILGKTLPQVSSAILTVALLSLVLMIVVDLRQRPPRPKTVPILRAILTPFEFLFLPVIGFFFNALPGIDAHTRLMLGKYIEYRVTEKV